MADAARNRSRGTVFPKGGRVSLTPIKYGVTRNTNASTAEKRVAIKLLETNMKKMKERFMKTKVPDHVLRKINHLLNHPRNKNIIFKGRSYKVNIDGASRVYTGLKPKLKALFWPDTEDDPFKRDPNDLKRRPPLDMPKGSKFKRTCKLSGKAHGELVHKQVYKFVKKFTNKHTPVKIPLNSDPCTIHILNLFVKKGWIPVVSELDIFHEGWVIASSIDIIVLDLATFELILLETKTGHTEEEYGEHPTDKKLRAPLDDVVNCPKNRHMVQVVAMCLMLRDKYGILMDQAKIIRPVSRLRGAFIVPLPKWAIEGKNGKPPAAPYNINRSLTANAKS